MHVISEFNPAGAAYSGDDPVISARAAWYMYGQLAFWYDLEKEEPGEWVDFHCPPIAQRVWGEGNTPQAARMLDSVATVANRLATGDWVGGYLAHNMAEQIIVGNVARTVKESVKEGLSPEESGLDLPPLGEGETSAGYLLDLVLLDVDHEYLYNMAMDGIDQIAADPDSGLGIGDFLHPDRWWDTFGGVDDEEPGVDWLEAGRSTALELRMNTLIADGLAQHPNSTAWRSTVSTAAFMAGIRAAELGLTSKDDDSGTLFIQGFFEGLG